MDITNIDHIFATDLIPNTGNLKPLPVTKRKDYRLSTMIPRLRRVRVVVERK